MKKCPRCQKEKPLDSFHKDKTKVSGYYCYCKLCKKEKDAQSYSYSEQEKNRKNEWRLKFPERKNAHGKVRTAIKSGRLVRLPCFVCGDNAEAHHPDYSRPLDVVWLCSPHHRQAHAIV
jgi:hypothetical protein